MEVVPANTAVHKNTGKTAWNKGIPCSEETKAKVSAGLTGKKLSAESIAKRTATRKERGYKPPDRTGQAYKTPSEESIEKGRASRFKTMGVPYKTREEVEKARGPATRGELKKWAASIYKRDCGVCQYCGFKKDAPKSIQAHHILSVSKHPDLTLAIDNGITLCIPCHISEHQINGII